MPKMRFSLLSLIFSLSFFSGCASSPPLEERAAPAAQVAREVDQGGEREEDRGSAFLYRIEGGERPSYLLGTIHLGVSFYESLLEDELREIASSRVIYTELSGDLDLASIAAYFFLSEDEDLAPLIGPERFELLAKRTPDLGTEYLSRLKPWAALVFAGVDEYQRYVRSIGGDPAVSMDAELQAFARGQAIPNHGLETPEEQLGAFDAISVKEVIALIDELLEKQTFEEADELLRAYRSGEQAALIEALDMDGSRERAPAYYEQLLRVRNHRWLETLKPELKEGGLMIGVGAAHLFYEDGLIKLFEGAGYRVVKVR